MKLSRDDAVALFEALDYKAAAGWKKPKVAKMVADLPGLVDEDTELEDERLNELLCEVVCAVEEGKTIELIEDGETELDAACKAESDEPVSDEDADAAVLDDLYREEDQPAGEEMDTALPEAEELAEGAAVEPPEPPPEPGAVKEIKPKKKRGRPRGSKNKKRAVKEKQVRIGRVAAVYRVLRERGGHAQGITAVDLERFSTELMAEVNKKPAGRADQICKQTLAALVEFNVMKILDSGACRFVQVD